MCVRLILSVEGLVVRTNYALTYAGYSQKVWCCIRTVITDDSFYTN